MANKKKVEKLRGSCFRKFTVEQRVLEIAKGKGFTPKIDPDDAFYLKRAAKSLKAYKAMCEQQEAEETGVAWLERLFRLEDSRG